MTNEEITSLVSVTQRRWADLILEIGKAYKSKLNLDKLIFELLHNVYAFDHCDVLFKPTLAKQNQFRSKKEEFVSQVDITTRPSTHKKTIKKGDVAGRQRKTEKNSFASDRRPKKIIP